MSDLQNENEPISELDAIRKEAYRAGFAQGRLTVMSAVAGLSKNLAASLEEAESAHASAKRLLASFAMFMSTMRDDVQSKLRDDT
jgi:hypothetical protein